MPGPLETIQKEWPVISGAPWSFAAAVIVMGIIIVGFSEWIHQEEIAGKDYTIQEKQSQIDGYKDKLSGATPDEAKAQIADLKAQNSDLAARLVKLEPRRLHAQESSIILSSLKASGIPAGDIVLASDDGCWDCAQYADSFKEALSVPTWSILREEIGGGILPASPKGVAIVTPDPSNPLPEAKALEDALLAAKIPFDITRKRAKDEHPVWLLITLRPQD